MLEAAMCIPLLVGLLLFIIAFSVNIYQYLRMSHALRVAGRVGALESRPFLAGVSGCAAVSEQAFRERLGAFGTSAPPTVTTTIGSQNGIRGLRIQVAALLDTYILPNDFAPIRLRTESFFPLEDQAACQ